MTGASPSKRSGRLVAVAALAIGLMLCCGTVFAKDILDIPKDGISGQDPGQVATVLQVLLMLTIISLAPSILMMMTCFTRIVIGLSFLRRALATQQLPPDQIVVGLALFLTFAVMAPVFEDSYSQGLKPYLSGEKVSQEETLERSVAPFRAFMFKHARDKDLKLFISMNRQLVDNPPQKRGDVPTLVLVPAFVLSELRTAFWMGFLLYLPFLIIDLVVSSVLMSMGILFLPPVIISLPFKVLLFVMVDGWHLVVGQLVQSFG